MGSRKIEMGNFAAENEPAVRRMASPENPTRPNNGAFLSQGGCWKATPCGEIGSSLGRVRCVEACNVLSEENAEMFCDGQRGLDVRQAQTPSTPLKLLGTWPGQVARSRGGLWQFCCHRIANTALALSITVMQELIAESCNPSNKQPYPGQTGTAPRVEQNCKQPVHARMRTKAWFMLQGLRRNLENLATRIGALYVGAVQEREKKTYHLLTERAPKFSADIARKMLSSSATQLRAFEQLVKKEKEKEDKLQAAQDAREKDGLGVNKWRRETAAAAVAKLQQEQAEQEKEKQKIKTAEDKIMQAAATQHAVGSYKVAAGAKGDPMVKIAENAGALVDLYNKGSIGRTAHFKNKEEEKRWLVMQFGVSVGVAVTDAEKGALCNFHDAMMSTKSSGSVLKIRIEAENPLKPGQTLGVEDVAKYWRKEVEIPIEPGQFVSNTGPWLNPARAGKIPNPSFTVILKAGDQDEVGKLRDVLTASAEGEPILIEGIATSWTAETPHNVSVNVHVSESASAMLYTALCDKAEIPRSLFNAMLAENVKNSPGMETYSSNILSVSLDCAKFATLSNEQRVRCSLSPLDWAGQPNFSPTLRINMRDAAWAHKLARAQEKLVFELGQKLQGCLQFAGTTAAKTALQQEAGLGAARKRATDEVAKKLQRTDDILTLLHDVAKEAKAGRGEIALKKLLLCQSMSAGNGDVTAAFLNDHIQREVQEAKKERRVTPEQGGTLEEKVAVWKGMLLEEREKHEELGKYQTTSFQLAGFPPAKAKPWKTQKDMKKMKMIQGLYHPQKDVSLLQKDLQSWLKEEENLMMLHCELILNEDGKWNPEEGVIIATQHDIGFGQAADAAVKIIPRPRTLLSIFADNKEGAKQHRPHQIRIVWGTMEVTLPSASQGGAEELRRRIAGILRGMDGIWVPSEDKKGETLRFAEGRVVDDVKIHQLEVIDESATHDVRNLHTLLEVEAKTCENLLEVLAMMQHEKLIRSIAKVDGSVLFVDADMAEALQHVPGTVEIGVMKDDEWMMGMRAGESARDWLFGAIFKTLWPRLEHNLDGGVWIRGTSFNGLQGSGALDGRDTVEESGGNRWWNTLTQRHFVGKKGYHDIAEMVVRMAIEQNKAIAITKQGATFLLRPDSIFASAVVAADNMTPGDPLPTETLALDSLLLSEPVRQMHANLMAVGREWAPMTNTQDYGVELFDSDIRKRLEEGAMNIEFEMWKAAAGKITNESFIRGKRGTEDCLWRPKNKGAAMVFVEGQNMELEACRVHLASMFRAHTIPTLTDSDVMGEFEPGRYGAVGPRILARWAETGRGAHFQTEGGHVVVLPEVVYVNGKQREFTFEEQFTVQGATVENDRGDSLEETLMTLESGTSRAALEAYSDKAGRIKIEAVITNGPTVLSGVKWDEKRRLLLQIRAEEAPASFNMKDMASHPLIHNLRGLAWITKLIQRGNVRAVQVGRMEGHVLVFDKATARWCEDMAPETARAWDPLTQTMRDLQEAAIGELEVPAAPSQAMDADDENAMSSEEGSVEGDLMGMEDGDEATAGASHRVAPRGKGEPSGKKAVGEVRKKKK